MISSAKVLHGRPVSQFCRLSLFKRLPMRMLQSDNSIQIEGTETRKITKQTKILSIGHLPGHTYGKVRVLRAAGFENAADAVCCSENANYKDDIKEKLKNSPGCFFIVGGAMNSAYPQFMAELYAFIEAETPSIIVHTTSFADFPPDCPKPPPEDIVVQSALTVVNRYL